MSLFGAAVAFAVLVLVGMVWAGRLIVAELLGPPSDVDGIHRHDPKNVRRGCCRCERPIAAVCPGCGEVVCADCMGTGPACGECRRGLHRRSET